MVNQRGQFYTIVKSLAIEHIVVSQWKETFINTKNIIKLLLDSSHFSNLMQDRALWNITKATTELLQAAYGKIETK